MITGIIVSITCIVITGIVCGTILIINKLNHKKDIYYTVNNRLRDLINEIEYIKNNKLKLDINILLDKLKDIRRL